MAANNTKGINTSIITRQQHSSAKRPASETTSITRKRTKTSPSSSSDKSNNSKQQRWIAHQMLDDYVSMVSNWIYPVSNNTDGSNGYVESLSLESYRITALGYLQSPLRRPTVWEDWSPKEVAMFEAAIMLHGKEFSLLSKKYLPNKSTKDVVAFYYAWKKTEHYKAWKSQYEPDDGAWVMINETKKQKSTSTNTSSCNNNNNNSKTTGAKNSEKK